MKRILKILLAIILLGMAVAYYLYQKPTELLTSGNADFTYTIEELEAIGATESDTTFNQSHVGKKVELIGVARAKNIQSSGATIFFETENENIIVAAAFDGSLNNDLQEIELGSNLEILCICNGIAKPEDPDDLLSETTISFNRCSILNDSYKK